MILIQRIIRVGNSAAVTIPKKILVQQNLDIGDEAEIEVRPLFEANKEIHRLTQNIISKYRPALEELAKK